MPFIIGFLVFMVQPLIQSLYMSFCDVQSPLNTVSNISDSNQFYLDFYDNPEAMAVAMDRTAELLIDFTRSGVSPQGNPL